MFQLYTELQTPMPIEQHVTKSIVKHEKDDRCSSEMASPPSRPVRVLRRLKRKIMKPQTNQKGKPKIHSEPGELNSLQNESLHTVKKAM